MTARRKVTPGSLGVGAHPAFLLEVFGHLVREAFGETPYVVGSATWSKTPRDVDVRLILPHRLYRALFMDPIRYRFEGHVTSRRVVITGVPAFEGTPTDRRRDGGCPVVSVN